MIKRSEMHIAVTPGSLPIVTDVGPGNEHESRKLIPLLKDIQIRKNVGRPRNKKCICADIKYDTFPALTYLSNRHIKTQIKERKIPTNLDQVYHISSSIKNTRKSGVV
ncbi:MAG: transposase [Thermoproteota archaeon]|nr:transposase [Thermoproteota archaeon]